MISLAIWPTQRIYIYLVGGKTKDYDKHWMSKKNQHKILLKIILVWISTTWEISLKGKFVTSATSYLKETYPNVEKGNHSLRITIWFQICPYIYVSKDMCKASSDVMRCLSKLENPSRHVDTHIFTKWFSQTQQSFIHWHFVTCTQIFCQIQRNTVQTQEENKQALWPYPDKFRL